MSPRRRRPSNLRRGRRVSLPEFIHFAQRLWVVTLQRAEKKVLFCDVHRRNRCPAVRICRTYLSIEVGYRGELVGRSVPAVGQACCPLRRLTAIENREPFRGHAFVVAN